MPFSLIVFVSCTAHAAGDDIPATTSALPIIFYLSWPPASRFFPTPSCGFPCPANETISLTASQPAARDCERILVVMLAADYGERGVTAASRATSAIHSPADHFLSPAPQPSTSFDDTESSTWSSLGRLTANTSTTNLSPTNFPQYAIQNTTLKPQDSSSINLDLSTPESLARNELLLQDSSFLEWKDQGAPENFETPEDLQKQDPLGTQIWKLYSRTKSRLPNQERMENLTWRMMAMNLRRREQLMQAQAAYERNIQSGGESRDAGADTFPSAKQKNLMSPPQTSTPSGIAQQLRRSVDQATEPESAPESMNLDDFIIPSSVASPAGIMSPAPTEGLYQPRAMHGQAIPIAARSKLPQVQIPKTLPPSSVPQSSIAWNKSSEFDYVQRRVRKTSIDERRSVSWHNTLHT